jgi:phosphoribosylformimino-5-aminoimidazole carboxamide ribotide isomerase
MRLLPSIDLRDGQCVRLLHGDFDAETRYDITPQALHARYRALGAQWLHCVDLDGARDGKLANRDLIEAMAADGLPRLQVGGGVRSREIVEDLLQAGIGRVIVGSAAIETPEDVARWIEVFGPERIGLAIDVRLDADSVPRVQTRGWRRSTSATLWDTVQQFLSGGLRHVLCTDIDRDGALQGPNLGLYADCVRRFPAIEWQASGGVRDAQDLEALAEVGVAQAISGKALLERRFDDATLVRWLAA